jgi:hypothetical protein
MKPSDFAIGATSRPAPQLKFPCDPKADPPISIQEAIAATSAICPAHGGIFGQRGEKQGDVYLCLHPSCRMYRRYVGRPLWRTLRYNARSLISRG